MKSFIVLFAVVAVATATPGFLYGYHFGAPIGIDGRVVETPEVAAAKSAHLAQHAYESVRNTYGHAYGYAPAVAYTSYPLAYAHAAVPVVADTPEVAKAKIEHFAAHAKEAAKHGVWSYAYSPSYAFQALAWPGSAPLGSDGRVVNTPEVEKATAEHLQAHAKAAAQHD